MLKRRYVAGVVVASLVLMLGSCGGRANITDPQATPLNPDSHGAPVALQGLPAWDGLPPGRELSVIGPGWAVLAPQETVQSGNSALGPGAALTLNAAGDIAYAMYGVAGFDGDNGPTSARITLSSITGQYYVGFSDYVAGTWRFAGPYTSSATVEIPLTGGDSSSEYLSASAFTSPAGTCYFVVALPEGGLLTLTGVELGVQGGVNGPLWTSFDSIQGGATGCMAHWRPSASRLDPDFAGYYLERAPLLSGDFVRLGPGVIAGEFFLDDTAVIDVAYRYRVAAVDASGNLSLWSTTTGGATTGTLVDPVPVLHAPRGPLYSPAQVTLDLADSYDPEGVGITDYAFQFLLFPESTNGPSPTATVTLPPGCHIITGMVTTGDGRSATVQAYVKVYPTWQAAPAVVATPVAVPTQPRLIELRCALQPGTTRPLVFGTENATRSASIWYQLAGGAFSAERVPLLDPVAATGEPLTIDNGVYIPLATGTMFQFAVFEAGKMRWYRPGVSVEGFSSVAAGATAGDRVYLFVAQDTGGIIDLTAFDLNAPGLPSHIIAPNIVGLNAVAVAYNAPSSCFDIAFSTPVDTQWARWDPLTDTIVLSAVISLLPSSQLDIEQHPATNRPGIARFDTVAMRWVYTELDAALAWIADELVDNTGVNSARGDLAYGAGGNAFMYFATAPGPSHLHERTGVATWAPRNTPAYAATAGLDAALVNLPGTDNFIGVDRIAGQPVVIGRLTDVPDETLVEEISPFQVLLNNIQGAAGTVDTTPHGDEELHVIFNDSMAWSCNHYTSTTGGSTWAAEATTSFRDSDMAATQDGGIYVSNNVALNHELHFWDTTVDAFVLYTIAPGSMQDSFLAGGLASDDVRWTSYDDAGSLTYTTGHFGVAPSVVTAATAVTPVWGGAGDATGFSTIYCAFGGGASYNEARWLWGPTTDGVLNTISDSLAVEVFEAYDVPSVSVKQSAGCSYLSLRDSLGIGLPNMALWTTYGPLLEAQRYDISLTTGSYATELPLQVDLIQDEPRRSVTAGCAAGWTAVGLVALVDGTRAYFEWSDYGRWERLELPPQLSAACNPELIIGRDGRWHIVYWDWLTDRVLCLNSL